MPTALTDLPAACNANGGIEDPEGSGFVFRTASRALKAAAMLGQKIVLPPDMRERRAILGRSRDGRLRVSIRRERRDRGPDGWSARSRSGLGSAWTCVYDAHIPRPRFVPTAPLPIRYVEPGRWQCQISGGTWVYRSYDDARSVLHACGYRGRIREILAECRRNPVKID
jgi:hypothetical protein